MSYQVLARKWRPQAFDDVLGQQHVTDVLKNMLTTGRLHHGYLFSGIRGIGKTTTARILAKALNCVNGPTPEPCNQCEFCREITDGYSIDVEEIDGASNRGVDDVRILQDNASYAPSRSRYNVFIIDEVHMLTTEAFNALLKTMEEPPANVVFILATTEPWKIPVTILSRCQQFEFQHSTPEDLLGLLRKIAEHEGITISDNSLNVIIKTAGGSVRDAENLFDQVIGFSGHAIQDGDVRDVLGIPDGGLLHDTFLALIQHQPAAMFAIMERLVNQGYNLRLFCMELMERLRNMIVLKVARHPEPYLVLFDYGRTELERYALHAALSELQQWYWLISTAEQQIKFSPQPRFLLEMALTRMAHVVALDPLDDLAAQVDELETQLEHETPSKAHGTPPPQTSSSPAVSSNPTLPPTPSARPVVQPLKSAVPKLAALRSEYPPPSPKLQRQWSAIVEALKPKRRGIVPMLRKAVPLELTDAALVLGFHSDSQFARRKIDDSANLALISETVAELTGHAVRVQTTEYDDAPSTEAMREQFEQSSHAQSRPAGPAETYTPPASSRRTPSSARASSSDSGERKRERQGDRKGGGEWKGRGGKQKSQYKAPVQVKVADVVRLFEGEIEE